MYIVCRSTEQGDFRVPVLHTYVCVYMVLYAQKNFGPTAKVILHIELGKYYS